MKIHGNTNQDKAKLKKNLFNRLKSLYVLFPSNHPLHVEYSHTKWEIPNEVIDKIWAEVQGAMVTARQSGFKKGYEKGLIDGALAVNSPLKFEDEEIVLSEELASAISGIIEKPKNRITFRTHGKRLGIATKEQWGEFCKEFIKQGDNIAKAFKIRNFFEVDVVGKEIEIWYNEKVV